VDALAEARNTAEAAADDAAAALEAERATLAEAREQLEAEHRERLQAADAKVSEAEAVLAQEREAMQAKLAAARTNAQATDASEDRIAELTESLSTLEARLAEAEASAAALQAELDATQAAHDAALTEARTAGEASAAQIHALYSDAAELGGRLTDDGILLTLAGDELRFASGTATLPDGDLPSLDRVAKFLSYNPGLTARVLGHTDSSGNAAVNQELSRKRAEAVREALIARGVAAGRITAAGSGASEPVADNATEAGRRANRRVEVYAVSGGLGRAAKTTAN
jgi:outer membrane protein OmpA-like peptidoglycan-associated protein